MSVGLIVVVSGRWFQGSCIVKPKPEGRIAPLDVGVSCRADGFNTAHPVPLALPKSFYVLSVVGALKPFGHEQCSVSIRMIGSCFFLYPDAAHRRRGR